MAVDLFFVVETRRFWRIADSFCLRRVTGTLTGLIGGIPSRSSTERAKAKKDEKTGVNSAQVLIKPANME
jgi:hypothetical protein